jgi:predicted LPLAT superfamily acyltransferase
MMFRWRLIAGLPIYLLALARRRWQRHEHWSRLGERGSLAGIRFVWWIYRAFGRGWCVLLMYPVIAYFWLTGGRARRASRDYLRRVEATARSRGIALPPGLNSFRHFMRFGEALLDRLAAWHGELTKTHKKVQPDDPHLHPIAPGRGGIMIGSHLGDLEAARAIADHQSGHIKIDALASTRNAERFYSALRAINPRSTINVFQVTDIGPETAMRLSQRIEAGEWLVIMGDRTPVTRPGQAVWAEFLGQPAPFPPGPFVLASVLECPVYTIVALAGPLGFEMHLELFAERLEIPRKGRAAALAAVVQRFARHLEQYCLQAPLQWYNFYDFWHLSDPPGTTERPVDRA